MVLVANRNFRNRLFNLLWNRTDSSSPFRRFVPFGKVIWERRDGCGPTHGHGREKKVFHIYRKTHFPAGTTRFFLLLFYRRPQHPPPKCNHHPVCNLFCSPNAPGRSKFNFRKPPSPLNISAAKRWKKFYELGWSLFLSQSYQGCHLWPFYPQCPRS